MKATPDEIRRRFERLGDYLSDLNRGQAAIPDAPIALEVVATTAAAVSPEAKTLLDVGCGGGNYALKILERLPGLDVTLLDLSPVLLARASDRVSNVAAGRVSTIEGEIREVDLVPESFDIIVAGAVLHHLRDRAEWRHVFSKLFRSLRPNGALWISDLVAHDQEAVEATMRGRYGDFLLELWGAEGRDKVFEEIAEQDSPRSLGFQIALLREAGFSNVEILHKNSCFATFGAFKPGRRV